MKKGDIETPHISIESEKTFLSPICDLYDVEIVDCSISDRPDFAQTNEMFDRSFVKILDGTNLILHFD